MRNLMKAYPDLETWDEEQEDRLEALALYVLIEDIVVYVI